MTLSNAASYFVIFFQGFTSILAQCKGLLVYKYERRWPYFKTIPNPASTWLSAHLWDKLCCSVNNTPCTCYKVWHYMEEEGEEDALNLPLDMFARLPGAQGHRVRAGLEHERGPGQLWADAGLHPGAGEGADGRRPGTPLLPHHIQHRGQNHLLLLPLQPGTASVGCHLHHQVSGQASLYQCCGQRCVGVCCVGVLLHALGH